MSAMYITDSMTGNNRGCGSNCGTYNRRITMNNNFDTTIQSLFKGMDSFITTKTVVGDAVTIGDTIILPLVDVSFGVGAGAFAGDKNQNAGGGMGAKISPSAILVISGGVTKLVNVKNQDTVTKILDMVPDCE